MFVTFIINYRLLAWNVDNFGWKLKIIVYTCKWHIEYFDNLHYFAFYDYNEMPEIISL